MSLFEHIPGACLNVLITINQIFTATGCMK